MSHNPLHELLRTGARRIRRWLGVGGGGRAPGKRRAPPSRRRSTAQRGHRSGLTRRHDRRRGHVRRVLDETDEAAVLVGHSYSGMVIAELADHPKVRHSVYLCALWPERGQSALNLMGDVLPPLFFARNDGTMQIVDDFDLAWQAFCPDMDRAGAQQMISRSVLQSYSSATTPSTAPDRAHPATTSSPPGRQKGPWSHKRRERREPTTSRGFRRRTWRSSPGR